MDLSSPVKTLLGHFELLLVEGELGELKVRNAAREQLELDERRQLPQFVSDMASAFYNHSFYDAKYVEDVKARLADKMGGLLKQFRYNYLSASPTKKGPAEEEEEEQKPRFETEEALLQEMKILYQAVLQSKGRIVAPFQTFVTAGLEYFASREDCKAFLLQHFLKTKEEVLSSDLDEDSKGRELKLQVLVRLELEHWAPAPESCTRLAEEAVCLLRSLMFVKDPREVVDFFEDVLRERFADGLHPLLMDISSSLGLDAFDEEEEDPVGETGGSAASSPPLWSISSLSSTQQPSTVPPRAPPPRGSYSHIPLPPSGVIPYKQKKLQILVSQDTFKRCISSSNVEKKPDPRKTTPVKKRPEQRPAVTTPRGRHVLKDRFVKCTPDRRQGPRSELRRSKVQGDDDLRVVPRSPRRSAPLKRSGGPLFRTPDSKRHRLDSSTP